MPNIPRPPIPPDVCPPEPPAIPALEVTFPGGATLQSFPTPRASIDPLLVAKTLVDQAAPLLGSLAPFFKLLDLVMGLVKLGQAIPDSITQLSPQPIIEALEELAPKVAAVIKLIPQLSIPVMIVNLIDLIIVFLQGLVEQLEAFAVSQAQGQALLTDPSPAAQAIGQCIIDSTNTKTANLVAGLGPLGKILEIVNLMSSLAGLPGLPAIGDFTTPAEGVELLSAFVETIADIRDSIPI